MREPTPHPTATIDQKIRYRLVWNHAHRLNKRGEGLVQIELQQGHRRRYISTHTYLPPENWLRGRIIGTPDDYARNYALRRMMWDVEQVELEFLKKGLRLQLPAMMDAVRSNVNPAAKLRDFTSAMLQDGTRKPSTLNNYRTLMNDIDRFRPSTYLNDIDYQWLQAYERYLKEKEVKHNTRISRLRILRAIINEALRRDLISSDPYRRMKIGKMEAKHGFLTFQQLHKLEQLPLAGKDDTVRDLFLTGCYTGLRFSDIATLTMGDISPALPTQDDVWLKKKMQKTGGTVEIPVSRLFNGKFLRIIEKHGGNIGQLTAKMPANSDTNRTLRRLLVKVKADEHLTFHSSRHTFATLLGKQGIGLATIQKLLGHSDAAMTMIYNEAAHTTNQREIEQGLKKLETKKNNKRSKNR